MLLDSSYGTGFQLEHYEEYVRKAKYDDYRILYLTLAGKQPTEQSIGNINQRKLKCVSFKEEICSWLNLCIDICDNNRIESSFIKQYKLLVEKLVEEDILNSDILEIISTKEKLQAGIEIANTLPQIKGDILYRFLHELSNQLDKKGLDVLYKDYECAKEYYGPKSIRPNLVYHITELKLTEKKTVVFGLGVEVICLILSISLIIA